MATQEESARDKARFGREELPASGDLGPLVQRFTHLTRNLLMATTVGAALEEIVLATLDIVPGADLVSVTLRSSDGAFQTPVETSEVATTLDQMQYEAGEGPCVDMAGKTGPAYVRSDDLATEHAWPSFGPVAADLGVRTALAITLLQDAQSLHSGALNIYSYRPRGLAADAHEAGLLLATHASLALADTEASTRAELTTTNLRRAIASRDVIGQAKGILMQRHGISADEAFDELRRLSQTLNVKLVDLAEVVATRRAELDVPKG